LALEEVYTKQPNNSYYSVFIYVIGIDLLAKPCILKEEERLWCERKEDNDVEPDGAGDGGA
jgi:hypothetical protein